MGDGRARRENARQQASERSFNVTMFQLGLVLVVAAIAGGSVKALGFEIPVIASLSRQVALGVVGGLLVGLSFWRERTSDGRAGVEHRPRRLHATMPSEVARNEWVQVHIQICLPNVEGLAGRSRREDAPAGLLGPPRVQTSPVPVVFPRARTGVIRPTDVEVHVDGKLFEIPEPVHRITLRPATNSGIVAVGVRPLHTSVAAVIVVRAIQELQTHESVVLGSASLTTRIVSERATRRVERVGSITGLGETTEPRGLMRKIDLSPAEYQEHRRAHRSVTFVPAAIVALTSILYLLYRLLER